MGVDYVLFERLAELASRFAPKGRSLMLGRQAFRIQPQHRKRYDAALRAHGRQGGRFDYIQADGFSETMFRKMGLGEIEALDFSDYEGAGIVHDLNRPVPAELEGRFDFIFDGGTLEHVFDMPVALRSVFRMLAPGGRFVSAGGLNGWPGHGLYQVNPELAWSFWVRSCGCRMVDCRGILQNPNEGDYSESYPDPAERGVRLRLGRTVPPGRVYLYYEVERTPGAELSEETLQSDYQARWDEAAEA